MCRVLRVLVVAPPERHAELRRALASIEYEVVGAVAPGAALEPPADVAVVVEPDRLEALRLRSAGLKVVAVGGGAAEADLTLEPADLPSFTERVWELFRPSA